MEQFMTYDDAANDGGDADFQRWYFGGSPPESDGWDRHAFEDALHGAAVGIVASVADVPSRQPPARVDTPAHYAMA